MERSIDATSLLFLVLNLLTCFSFCFQVLICFPFEVPETTDDNCQPGVPCEYPDSVDLRIIVLTYNRWQSLLKLLNSLNDLKFDGDRVSMEIWIDRSAGPNGLPDQSTVVCARSFRWKHGDVRVHVQKRHVGIYGQWIDTWKPVQASQRSKNETDELVLILEDDLTVSPFAYRWLKAAHRFYSNRTDLAGFTLQSEGLIVASNGAPFNPNRQKTGPSYMYALLGSWGFSPNPDVWRRFQDWYHRVSKDRNFKPYVNGLIMTRWYKDFERRGTSNSMWTMWFIYFCEQNRLYTVYNNISLLMNSTTKGCLAINRREPGLHFQGKANVNTACLSWDWSDAYVDFREPVGIYGFDGKPVNQR